jgi:putative flippase GtrA
MIRREIGFFILNGIISVILAYIIYQTLVSGRVLGIHWASGTAYICGMAYGFFSNRRWAFQDRRLITRKTIILFATLYFFTLIVNVSVNAIMLELIAGLRGDILLPFITAISISTILNFIGLKYFVFNQKRDITIG